MHLNITTYVCIYSRMLVWRSWLVVSSSRLWMNSCDKSLRINSYIRKYRNGKCLILLTSSFTTVRPISWNDPFSNMYGESCTCEMKCAMYQLLSLKNSSVYVKKNRLPFLSEKMLGIKVWLMSWLTWCWVELVQYIF